MTDVQALQQDIATLRLAIDSWREEQVSTTQCFLTLVSMFNTEWRKHTVNVGEIKRLSDEQIADLDRDIAGFASWYRNTHDEAGQFVGGEE